MLTVENQIYFTIYNLQSAPLVNYFVGGGESRSPSIQCVEESFWTVAFDGPGPPGHRRSVLCVRPFGRGLLRACADLGIHHSGPFLNAEGTSPLRRSWPAAGRKDRPVSGSLPNPS